MIVGRAATEEDLKSGTAVFWIASGSEVFDLGRALPIKARFRTTDECDDGTVIAAGTEVSIVQAEKSIDENGPRVTIGFLNGSEQGVCLLEELELL